MRAPECAQALKGGAVGAARMDRCCDPSEKSHAVQVAAARRPVKRARAMPIERAGSEQLPFAAVDEGLQCCEVSVACCDEAGVCGSQSRACGPRLLEC